MTTMLAAIASMLTLTALASLARKASPWPVCPICAGVAGTWLALLAARAAGLPVEPLVLAMFLGASVLGGAQWVEARLPEGRSPLLWKALALPAGFAAAYGVASQRWGAAALAALVLAALAAAFLRARGARGDAAVVAELEERMKKCC